jgi:hypothetical protein
VIDINAVRESNVVRNEWKRLEEEFSKNFKMRAAENLRWSQVFVLPSG